MKINEINGRVNIMNGKCCAHRAKKQWNKTINNNNNNEG